MMSATAATATASAKTNASTTRLLAAKAPAGGQTPSNKMTSIQRIVSTFLPPTKPSPAADSAVDVASFHSQSSSSSRIIEEVVSGSNRPPSIALAPEEKYVSRREHNWAPPGTTKIDPSDPISPPPPLLLLEGDKYCISKDGIARTLYRCDDGDVILGDLKGDGGNCTNPTIAIEEIYDIPNSTKRYVVHNRTRIAKKSPDGSSFSQHQPNFHPAILFPPVNNTVQGYIHFGQQKQQQSIKDYGDDHSTIEVKEYPNGVLNGLGTGSTTWDSSIVMSIIFNEKPQLLQGHVIELGCGVGFGGILMGKAALSTKTTLATTMKSMTLTDYSSQILEQCRMNVTNMMGKLQQRRQPIPMHVEKLDWYDSVLPSSSSLSCHAQQRNYYDTIIACDCAYQYDDIEALAKTMIQLLNHNNPKSQILIFGPANRGGLHELIFFLRRYKLMIEIKSINMVRYRISPDDEVGSTGVSSSEVSPYETKSGSRYLQVTCTPWNGQLDRRSPNQEVSMAELD